ncbi:hypothetical protein KPH14_006194 [Odynerus spinipes]|uniref:Uncharacterized protein n=1 Tax=Odynerus spinipes TaxID=1348599 RepID=A0AAD9RIS5_9HYME|nr:hypothetical protein KPH14_006194 [Odynerus spinipes]
MNIQRMKEFEAGTRRKKLALLLTTDNMEDESQMDLALHGELPGKIVDNIFEQVQRNEALKVALGPGLYRKSKSNDSKEKTYLQNASEDKVRQTEKIMEKIIELLDRMVLDEVQKKTCVTLPTDMRQFLEWMLNMNSDEESQEQVPPLPLVHDQQMPDHSGDDTVLFPKGYDEQSDDEVNELRKKVRILQNLINEYNALTAKEKTKVQTVHDYLVRQLNLLLHYIETKEKAGKEKSKMPPVHVGAVRRKSGAILRYESAIPHAASHATINETQSELKNSTTGLSTLHGKRRPIRSSNKFWNSHDKKRKRRKGDKKRKRHKGKRKHHHGKRYSVNETPEYRKLVHRAAMMRKKRSDILEDEWNPFDFRYEEPEVYKSMSILNDRNENRRDERSTRIMQKREILEMNNVTMTNLVTNTIDLLPVKGKNRVEDEMILLNKREAWKKENERQLEEVAFGKDMRNKLGEEEQFKKLTEINKNAIIDQKSRDKRENPIENIEANSTNDCSNNSIYNSTIVQIPKNKGSHDFVNVDTVLSNSSKMKNNTIFFARKMAFNELEERISKIRQQNEEIKRRYEEVEEDKKNAAKLNALVQMVPSTDWPERKEPPEYSNPPKVIHKQKSVTKEQSEQHQQHHPNDRKKGEGPPPDPKYNFLADAEREEHSVSNMRDNTGNKTHNRSVRGNFKKRGTGREGQQRGRTYHGTHRDEHKPEYEAWRKERNRIDEDRISRQKTAEGNWRREWDNDKAYLVNEVSKAEGKGNLGDFAKKDHKDGRHSDGNGYTSHNRGAYHKSYRGSSRNFHNSHDYHHMNSYDQHNHDASSMNSTSVSIDERTVIATDKSIKVMVNQSTITKGPVMSVKVNSPSIAGTGRVGPRQRTRLTYSSHSDVEANTYESGSFPRQKSFEDKSKGNHFNNTQKTPNLRRPQSQKKKENDAKSPYSQRKEYRKENPSVNSSKHYENESQQNFVRKDYKDTQKFHYPSKSPRTSHKKMKMQDGTSQSNDATNECSLKTEKTAVESDSIESQKVNTESLNAEVKIDESSVVIEEQSKTDVEESNEVTLENSECSPYNPEAIDEQIEESNYDANISSTTNEDSVNISENKNTAEETKDDNPAPSSPMQDINNDIESANDEKEEIGDSSITVDNTTEDSCISDNNKNTLDTTTQVENLKAELVQEDLFSTTNDKLSEEDLNKSNDPNDIAITTSEKTPETSYEELSTNVCMVVEEESSTSTCAVVKEESSTNTCTIVKEESSTSTCAVVKEELPTSTCVIVKEDDTTCHDNKVPVEENVLPVDNTNDKSAIKNVENLPLKCIDENCITETSEDSSSHKVEDHNEAAEKIVENVELQNKDIEPVVDEKHSKSENTQVNSDNKEN